MIGIHIPDEPFYFKNFKKHGHLESLVSVGLGRKWKWKSVVRSGCHGRLSQIVDGGSTAIFTLIFFFPGYLVGVWSVCFVLFVLDE